VAAGVGAGIADETVLDAIASAMEYTIGRTSDQADWTTGYGTGDHFVYAVLVTEVASNHLGTANSALDAVLESGSRNVPCSSHCHRY